MNKNKIVLILFLVVVGTVGIISNNKRNYIQPIQQKNNSNPLPFSTYIKTNRGTLVVEIVDEVINLFPSESEEKNVFKSISIKKENYPKLFEQGVANSSSISSKLIDEYLIELSNNELDHGLYSTSYRLTANLVTGEIKENTHPRRDDILSKEDSKYLEEYPKVSELIGNSSVHKLDKGQFVIGNKKLEFLVAIPITYANGQRLFVFDKDSVYVSEKGFEMSIRKNGENIEIRYFPEMIGVEENEIILKVYSFDKDKKTMVKIDETNDNVLRRQSFEVNDKKFEAIFSSGIDCGSCHGQTLSLVSNNYTYLTDNGADIRVKLINNKFYVKSQLSGGGAPSPENMGIIKVYDIDIKNKTLTKIKEYQEEYTLDDYEGR